MKPRPSGNWNYLINQKQSGLKKGWDVWWVTGGQDRLDTHTDRHADGCFFSAVASFRVAST